MPRSFFVPAQNSRHRIAAIALYRALVRTAREINLPQHVQASGRGAVHPVAQLIRKRFEGNKNYTSLRLVYSSMAAGYKFLTMLTKAQTLESAEHAQLVDFLLKRKQHAEATRAKNPPRLPEQPQKSPEKEPSPLLLTNIARPEEAPKYVGKPRPLESLSRHRRVPNLAVDSMGYPILRYSKPHPEVLDMIVRRNRQLWESKIEGIIWVEEDLGPRAVLEDQWEESIRLAMIDAELMEPDAPRDPEEQKFAWSAMQCKLWYEWRLEGMWQRWTARGEAMHRLVQEERALAAKEAAERNGDRSAKLEDFLEPPEEKPKRKKKWWKEFTEPKPVMISDADPMPALNMALSIKQRLANSGQPFEEDSRDLYISPVWSRLAEQSKDRLRRWVQRTKNSNKARKGDDNLSDFVRAQRKAD